MTYAPIPQEDLGAWEFTITVPQYEEVPTIETNGKWIPDKCPNCGATINPFHYRCDYCGSWIYIGW